MSQIVSDNFTRANAVTLGANWTKVAAGHDDIGIASNKASINGASVRNTGVYTGAGWTGGVDHYAEITLVVCNGNNAAPLARAHTSDTTSYECRVTASTTLGAACQVELYSIDASEVETLISSTVNMTINVNDVIYVEANGTAIVGKVNGVTKVSATNSVVTTGKPGIFLFDNFLTAAGVQLTLFAAGDFAAVVASVTLDDNQPMPWQQRI